MLAYVRLSSYRRFSKLTNCFGTKLVSSSSSVWMTHLYLTRLATTIFLAIGSQQGPRRSIASIWWYLTIHFAVWWRIKRDSYVHSRKEAPIVETLKNSLKDGQCKLIESSLRDWTRTLSSELWIAQQSKKESEIGKQWQYLHGKQFLLYLSYPTGSIRITI